VEFAGFRIPSVGRDGPVTIVVRPEDVRLGADWMTADVIFEGRLEDMVYLGAMVRYRIILPGGQRVIATSSDRAIRSRLAIGEPVWCGWSFEDQRIIEE
jgi:ABC-type Fe3+/spermidine/putrescine transport system ATPase subunit